MKPTIGRIVHYVVFKNDKEVSRQPAIVLEVTSNLITIKVFDKDKDFFVTLTNKKEYTQGIIMDKHCWEWPPRE
jgi:hypothetical protein